MEKELFKKFVFFFVISLCIFGVVKSFLFLRKTFHDLQSAKKQVTFLERERDSLTEALKEEKELAQNLAQINEELKDYARLSKRRITKLFTDFDEARKEVERISSQFSILKAENAALTEDKDKLAKENAAFKAKLSSVDELKKAIREVRRQAHQVAVKMKQNIETEEPPEGNRGYFMKDGKFVYRSKVRIEVIPAPTK